MLIDNPLFQAVLDEPESNEPRLILADWLEEHGDALRAEFIRVQIELAQDAVPEYRIPQLLARERELLKQRRRFNAPLHRFLNTGPLQGLTKSRRGQIRSWSYTRGFVESVVVEANTFTRYHDWLFQLGPLQSAKLLNPNQAIANLVACDGLLKLNSLTMASELQSRTITLLANSPKARNLRELDVSATRLDDRTVNAISESPYLKQLKRLYIHPIDANWRADSTLRLFDGNPKVVRLARDESTHTVLVQQFRRFSQRRDWFSRIRQFFRGS